MLALSGEGSPQHHAVGNCLLHLAGGRYLSRNHLAAMACRVCGGLLLRTPMLLETWRAMNGIGVFIVAAACVRLIEGS
jgi:hypothetical protein